MLRSDHAVECAVLSIIRTKLRRNQQGEKMYRNNLTGLTAAVTTLRMVSLKWRLEWTVRGHTFLHHLVLTIFSEIRQHGT